MRTNARRGGRWVGLTLWACLLVPAWTAWSQEAKVTHLKGAATASYDKGAPAALKLGDAVRAGAVIATGQKTKLELKLGATSVIRLGSDSRLELKQALFTGKGTRNVAAELLTGRAYAAVSKLGGSDSKFEISTGTAVAGVRGTAFRINKDDASTVVRVYAGAVAVSNAPLFQKKSGTQAAAGKKPCPGVKPCREGVKEVAGPREVTRKEWEEFVAKAMQEIRVAADGTMSAPIGFTAQAELAENEDEGWVAWNHSRDRELTPSE
jgi:hypothetical protein